MSMSCGPGTQVTWASPASFSTHQLTRTDALYFTVTTFTTVGFGDIIPASQGARLVVTAQMILDLLVLGPRHPRAASPWRAARCWPGMTARPDRVGLPP